MNKVINLISIILLLNCPSFHSITAIKNPNNNCFLTSLALITDTTKRKVDTVLLHNISTEILKVIKKRDYNKFASFIHPKYGIRFSPYSYIDTINNHAISLALFLKFIKQNKLINWGSSWEEKPELLTINQYFKKFVYDVDFLNAPLKSVNKFHSHGTDLNNIVEIYPDCDIIEFYFHGFKKENDGMDFRALRLVFKLYMKKIYLIAIVHDQWTP